MTHSNEVDHSEAAWAAYYGKEVNMKIYILTTDEHGVEPLCYLDRDDAIKARSELIKLAAYLGADIKIVTLTAQES